MDEVEYKNNEIMLYKTKAKLSLPHRKPEEVHCLVTQGHVVIEAEEPLKIPLVRIKDWSVRTEIVNIRAVTQAVPGTVTLRYRDASGHGQTMELEMEAVYDAGALASALKSTRDAAEIARRRLRWRDVWSRQLPYQTLVCAQPPKGVGLCAELCVIGVDARLVEPSLLPEESVADWGAEPFESTNTSIGLIEVRHSPIRLVNVLITIYSGHYGYGISYYKIVYLIPDSTLFPDSTMFWAGYEMPTREYGKSVRVKNVPLFGRVIDLQWRGNLGGDLIKRLNQDVPLKEALVRLREDIEILSYPECGCWTISLPSKRDRVISPSREQWKFYETIARHLLEYTGN